MEAALYLQRQVAGFGSRFIGVTDLAFLEAAVACFEGLLRGPSSSNKSKSRSMTAMTEGMFEPTRLMEHNYMKMFLFFPQNLQGRIGCFQHLSTKIPLTTKAFQTLSF